MTKHPSQISPLYQATVPMMIKSCHNLRLLLKKAEQHCIANGIEPADLLQHRLIADMLPLVYQVRTCSDTVKFMAVRVGGMENFVFEDKEKTFEELYERVDKTLNILNSLKSGCMDGEESRQITMSLRNGAVFNFTAVDYIYKFAIPNFHFHLSASYCIIRSFGVKVDLFDYLDGQKDLFVKE